MSDAKSLLSVFNILKTKNGMIESVIVLGILGDEPLRSAQFAYRNRRLARIDEGFLIRPELFEAMRALATCIFQKLKGAKVPENWRQMI